MQPTLAKEKPPQQRLRKFVRQPDKLAGRQVTEKGQAAIAIIERYRFVPTHLLVRLMPGDLKSNYRQLQTLFHKSYVNRFALPKYGGPGEFIYYLDSLHSLNLLADAGLARFSEDDRRRREEIIRYNRDKDYSQLHRDPDAQGKLLYIQHELMVSRFHGLLELACRSEKLAGKVILEQWKQGPELWNRVECPKVRKDGDTWIETRENEHLPHRPDAFFTLYFPSKPEGQQRSHFLYEADRGTENTTRFKLKLRAHWHFVVKQNRQRSEPYNVHGIRAVLIESTEKNWASVLREAARHPVISAKPSPLFWFTTSELFFNPATPTAPAKPLYTEQPEVVFKRIWATPVEDKFLNLAD